MTSSLQTDPRRSPRAGLNAPRTRPPLEMPVLFQLADLSHERLKILTPTSVPAPPPEAILTAPTVLAPSPVAEEPAASQPIAAVLETPKTEEKVEAISTPAAEEAKTELVTGAEPKAEERADYKAPDISQSEPAAHPDSTQSVNVPAPPKPVPVAPRERVSQRPRNRQSIPSSSNDWMRTHGKFIAVGFVMALIATIYLARNGDEPAPPSQDSEATSQADVAADSGATVTEPHTAKESGPSAEHSGSPALLSEANPAAESSSPGPHADLHFPAKEEGDKETTAQAADSKSLFPWKDEGAARVASKPEAARAKPQVEQRVNEPDRTPADKKEGPEAPSVYGPPSGNSTGSGHEPTAPGEGPHLNAPASYPVTSPTSYRDFSPQSKSPALQQDCGLAVSNRDFGPQSNLPPAPRATPAGFQNPAPSTAPPTRTSGPRYERTGSGLY